MPTRGEINFHKNKTRTIIKTVLYLSIAFRTPICEAPRKEKNIFEPSNGGIGMRLKITRTEFIRTVMDTKKNRDADKASPKKRMNSPKTRAIIRLERGPAKATIASPHL